MNIHQWLSLTEQGTSVIGLELDSSDRTNAFEMFYRFGCQRQQPVYVWNPGFTRLHQVVPAGDSCRLQATNIEPGEDVLAFLLSHSTHGIFLLEGVLESDAVGSFVERQKYQLLNACYRAEWEHLPQYWVIVSSYIQLPVELQGLVPVLQAPLPVRQQVEALVEQFCKLQHFAGDLSGLIRACQGLSTGEIQRVLCRLSPLAANINILTEQVLSHKVSKLRGRGLEVLSEPDVAAMGGLDLLSHLLDRVVALLRPDALNYGLDFPKGLILWGPPGTGKSLSAKLAAQKMAVPLIATDWGGLRGSSAYESEQNLRSLLATTESMAPCCLYFDDFDKGFAGWDSDTDGGVARRLSGKLLTWMQERTAPVYLMATVNRLGMLPPELIRRFDEIVFVDLPHAGAMFEIFNLHLAKYFTQFRTTGPSPWTDEDWSILLREYRLCTPAEVGRAVRKAAEEVFYQGRPGEITMRDLLLQRQLFTPTLIRDEDQILAIRNQAVYARPASGPDTSRFAIPHAELFD